MKKIIRYLMICLMVINVSSCYTGKQKMIISGTPGMEIYETSDKKKIMGIIGDDGRVKIKISRNGYYPILWARNPNTDAWTPFGLDYKYHRRNVTVALLTLYTLGLYQLFNPGARSDQCWDCFEYLKYQTINSEVPNAVYANIGERRSIKSSAIATVLPLENSNVSIASKLLLKDYGKILQGSYVGSGKLLKGKTTVETYENIKIVMERVDRNTVSVELLMDGNEAIFPSCNYDIKSQGTNNFVLTSENDDSSKIEIKNNQVVYNNLNVNIDGEIYKLSITALMNN